MVSTECDRWLLSHAFTIADTAQFSVIEPAEQSDAFEANKQSSNTFEAHVRRKYSELGEPCVLDGTNQKLLQWFQCGRWEQVQRDLRLVLPHRAADLVMRICEKHGVHDAFVCRRELINYKKALLTQYGSAHLLEKDLRQLVAFYRHVEYTEGAAYFTHSVLHSQLCDSLEGVRGVLGALHDGRLCTKAIACVGRWPGAKRNDLLERLPHSLKSATLLARAQQSLGSKSSLALSSCLDKEGGDEKDNCSTAGGSFHALLTSLQTETQMRPYSLHFIEQVLIVRGAAKALRIQHELKRYSRMLARVVEATKVTLEVLEAQPTIEKVRSRLAAAKASSRRSYTEQHVLVTEHAHLTSATEAGDSGGGSKGRITRAVAEGAPTVEVTGDEALGEATHMARHRCIAAALLPTLRECCAWAARIARARAGDRRLFVAGDFDASCATTMFVPDGFNAAAMALLERFRRGIDAHQARMHAQLVRRGWPPHLNVSPTVLHVSSTATPIASPIVSPVSPQSPRSQSPQPVQGQGQNRSGSGSGSGSQHNVCEFCGAGRPSLWIHRRVCFECERNSRAAGLCPFRRQNSRCNSRLFCTHGAHAHGAFGRGGASAAGGSEQRSEAQVPRLGRCLLCDEVPGCAQCRLYRGDGEEVARLARHLRPDAIFLDWDRTFCSTRGGGSPLKGSHTLDADLLALVEEHPGRVEIVTRNSYRDDISAFLVRYGAAALPVHTVRKKQSKAAVVCEPAAEAAHSGTGERKCVMFVDDSIEEHLDLEKHTGGNDRPIVHRVLFVRGAIIRQQDK